jgi:integrase
MAGSIENKGKGKYLLTAYCGYHSKGKQIRRRRTISAKSNREANKKLALFIAEVENGSVVEANNMTLSLFTKYWKDKYANIDLAERTQERQFEILKNRILPELGHLRLSKIKPTHILDFKQKLTQGGRMDNKTGNLSSRSIEMILGLLRSMLNKAKKWELISANPCDNVDMPKQKSRAIPIYDETQLTTFISLLNSEPLKYRLMVFLALTTGLRRSEMFGLEWQHIDFCKSSLRIEQSSLYIVGKGLITKDPKTELSNRLIAVPTSVIELLNQHKDEQAMERQRLSELWADSNRIFTTAEGKAIHPDTFNTWLKKFIRKHELPHISPHSFRHMSATFALDQGISLKSISSRLGHAKTSTTADIYAHALQSTDREIANKMDDFLSRLT